MPDRTEANPNELNQDDARYGFRCCHLKNIWTAPLPPETELSRQMTTSTTSFFFSSRRRHTSSYGDWSSDVCSSDLGTGAPFFLWVHYYDPHFPYEPPPKYAQLYAEEPYSGEVAAVDEAVGRLLDALEESGAAGRTAVLLTADHGEALGEHGEQTHAYFVYQSTLRVPLIATVPWLAAPTRRIGQAVSQVDLMPTALDLLGVAAVSSSTVQGRSVVPLLEGKQLPARPIIADCQAPWLEFGFSPLRVVRDGRWKYIDAPRPELYDLTRSEE